MNKIAELGKLLIEYQDYVETGLIVLAAVIVLTIIVKSVKKSKNRQKLLNDINETVTDINTKVDKINSKSAEVIYIDNRTGTSTEKGKTMEIRIPSEAEDEEEDFAEEQSGNTEETETETCEEEKKEEQKDIPKKFNSRDCAVSRQGREYTLEELIEQIQE